MDELKLVPDWCRHGIGLGPDHSCDAKLAVIGEAPGKWEDLYGMPYVGPAGRLQDEWWHDNGLCRADCYITNVYPYRPPANKIEAIPHDAIQFWTKRLHERLARLAGPVIIVPTGNTALRALFGDGRNISDWRGSITSVNLSDGRSVKCIPTIHPAATFRQPILQRLCRIDWKRISTDKDFPELRHPNFDITVEPSEVEFSRFMDGLQNVQPVVVDGVVVPPAMSCDVETDIKTKELLCVGFSYDGQSSMVLPLTPRALPTDSLRTRMWSYARMVASMAVPKLLQNGQFDAYHFLLNRIPLVNYLYDLMEMDHAYDPNDGGDVEAGDGGSADDGGVRISLRNLALLNTVYGNRQPFWKHTGKQTGDYSLLDLFRYNGVDNCCTWACYPNLYVQLRKAGMI